MFCSHCGNTVGENDRFCVKCGTLIERTAVSAAQTVQAAHENRRLKNIAMLEDTRRCVLEGGYTVGGQATELKLLPSQYQQTEVFLPDRIHAFDLNSSDFLALAAPCEYRCESIDSFAMARKRAGQLDDDNERVLVLNFANPFSPGGGVRHGASAQEEDLCRKSTLLNSLESPGAAPFYQFHHRLGSDLASDAVIISPHVEIIKGDDGELLKDSVIVSVMTCAAPNICDGLGEVPQEEYTTLLYRRIVGLLTCAAYNGYRHLVLGAFGCGAFGNDARLVSDLFCKAFRQEGLERWFRHVDFAVLCGSSNYNYDEFARNFRRKDPVSMKTLSILGDSISTFENAIPEGYKPYYGLAKSASTRVSTVEDTWWSIVANRLSMRVLVNNSYSGSRVSRISPDELFPSACSDERAAGLHTDTHTPDVVIVYMGTNDWGFGVPLSHDNPLYAFENAYYVMLEKLREAYPAATVYCCTLARTTMSSAPHYRFPFDIHGVHIESYNHIIRSAAQACRCCVIDLYTMSPYDTIDGTHPNADGMKTLANHILEGMAASVQ